MKLLVPVLLLSAAALTSVVAHAQRGDELLRLWVDAAMHHAPGKTDERAREVGNWSKDQLLSILGDVSDAFSPNAAIRHGAVLHLDIALRIRSRAIGPLFRSYPRTGPPPPPLPFYVVDGTGSGVGVSPTHLEFARALLRKLEPPEAERGFARIWYVASAAELARWKNFAELQAHLAHARDLLPGEPEILLATGCLHEFFAGPVVQAAARERSSLLVEDRTTSLGRAERYFRQALSANPALTEARIRLGRVLELQNKPREAVRELEIALGEAEDATQSYYALLFLGRAEEELGQLERARLHFERAAKLFPRAQSPRVALSRLAFESGDEQGAQRALDEARSTAARAIDPWWQYDLGPGRYAQRKLAELYQMLEEQP